MASSLFELSLSLLVQAGSGFADVILSKTTVKLVVHSVDGSPTHRFLQDQLFSTLDFCWGGRGTVPAAPCGPVAPRGPVVRARDLRGPFLLSFWGLLCD